MNAKYALQVILQFIILLIYYYNFILFSLNCHGILDSHHCDYANDMDKQKDLHS